MASVSKCFIATLPNHITDQQLERLQAWGVNQCERFDFALDRRDGSMRMLVMRKSENTQRGFQKLLRGTLKYYGVLLPERLNSWLKLFEVDEWQSMKQLASGLSANDDCHRDGNAQNHSTEHLEDTTTNDTLDSDEDVAIRTRSLPHCLQLIPSNLLTCN